MAHLFIVATPIGNLEDITLRALRVLKEVDAIFCEDTRITGKLLVHFGISKPLISLRERAQDKAIEKAVALLGAGKNIAYVSDAGTPGVSDPGGKLVAAITKTREHANTGTREHTITIIPIPGPSALIAAASITGIPMDHFLFLGFPPHKKGRNKFFAEVAASPYPIIFYESPHRIIHTIRELQARCHSREGGNPESWIPGSSPRMTKNVRLVVCRELTKKFETVYRGSIDEVSPQIEKNLRGEFVIIAYKS